MKQHIIYFVCITFSFYCEAFALYFKVFACERHHFQKGSNIFTRAILDIFASINKNASVQLYFYDLLSFCKPQENCAYSAAANTRVHREADFLAIR